MPFRPRIHLPLDGQYRGCASRVCLPPHRRRWGDSVCPVLHGGRLVGRLEAARAGGGRGVEVLAKWGRIPARPLRRALDRLAAMQAPRG